MSNNRHRIAPPPEMIQQWIDEPQYMTEDQLGKRMMMISMNEKKFLEIINKTSKYVSERELEKMLAELKELHLPDGYADKLRASRIPSLKDLALNDLDNIQTHDQEGREIVNLSNIRFALEALPDA